MGLGTVTHQRIGFLWPMGPFYWAAQGLHIPVWAAQRLWVGALLFAAGAGVLYLCRTVGLQGPGRFVAAFAFMLSPYFLEYVGRISILLLPWAGLGWLLAIVIRAVRTPGWRYPALVRAGVVDHQRVECQRAFLCRGGAGPVVALRGARHQGAHAGERCGERRGGSRS